MNNNKTNSSRFKPKSNITTYNRPYRSKSSISLYSNNRHVEQCSKCMGSGLMQMIPMSCQTCNGTRCIRCENNGGLKTGLYETCNICFGSGVITNG